MTDENVRVLLIEDHGIVREGVKLLLDNTDGIAVAGEAENGLTGVQLFARLVAGEGVDVVVTDLSLPDISGLEVTRRIKAIRPDTRVLLLTMHNDEEHIRGMIELGIDGYVLKQASAQDLPPAVFAVARGQAVLSPAVARRLMLQVQRGNAPERKRRIDHLTEREREVLRLMADGLTSKEIAQRLSLSTKTVENHRARILEKLGATNSAAAIGIALQEGLGVQDQPEPAEQSGPAY
jgi:DNA-binding NarL/FixJ family response regulator